MARAAVERGCWALAAQRRGVSLAELLGGVRPEVESGRALGIDDDPAVVVQRALAAVDAGYRHLRMKIEPGRDLEPVRRVRDAIGPDIGLSVDANGAYRLDDAEHLARLDGFGLRMLEQPLPARAFTALGELQKRLATPICLDESIETVDDLRTMLALGAGRVVNIKPGRVGGFTEAIAIHDLCLENGVPAWCGGMLETGLGRAYNAALASLPGFTLPGDLSPAPSYLAEDIVRPRDPTGSADGTDGTGAAEPTGFTVAVPNAPGVGADPDPDTIEDLTVRRLPLR
jgi:O-succinylbenzoate synthase